MITLDYNLNVSEVDRLKEIDWRNVDEADLDYYMFKGDIRFRVDKANFDAEWGWVTILDFATQIFEIVAELKGVGVFTFTESDAGIQFKRQSDIVVISSNYSEDEGIVDYEELFTSVSVFFRRVLTDLEKLFPELRQNVNFLSRIQMLKGHGDFEDLDS